MHPYQTIYIIRHSKIYVNTLSTQFRDSFQNYCHWKILRREKKKTNGFNNLFQKLKYLDEGKQPNILLALFHTSNENQGKVCPSFEKTPVTNKHFMPDWTTIQLTIWVFC